MPRTDRSRSPRRIQIGFLVLLSLAVAQVLWWILDQTQSSEEVLQRTVALYEADVDAARELLVRGVSAERIVELFPHVAVEDDAVRAAPEARQALDLERSSRLNQYRWEGTFFLAVLLAGMFILWRTLRQEAALRQRQQDFLAAVSHEFKSPLASLQLTAETIAKRPEDDRRQRWIDRILADVQRMSHMVSNLLDAAQLEKAEVSFSARTLDLAPAVEAVVAELSASAEECDVGVSQEIDAAAQIFADPSAVHTVVRNLLGNAIHAVAAQSGGSVRIEGESVGDRTELRVVDDGIGFEPSEAPNLFQSFYRVGDEIRRRSPGTGLGLSIVRRYVELEGGSVAARSDGPGRGAVFTVKWPRPAPGTDAPHSAEAVS